MNTAPDCHPSANVAALCQPGATPQDQRPASRRGLKARFNRRGFGPGFQPLGWFATDTQGVALGWNRAGALPLALAAESHAVSREPVERPNDAEVLNNIKEALSLSKGRC